MLGVQVRKTAMREVKVLQNVRHDNVVRLLDVFRLHRKLYLVFEFVEGTVLQVRLQQTPRWRC
jgi:cyclin-dependent kinase-like